MENLERCLQLYTLAAQEQDPKKLLPLIAELNRILEKDLEGGPEQATARLQKSA